MDYLYYAFYCAVNLYRTRTVKGGHLMAWMYLSQSLSFYLLTIVYNTSLGRLFGKNAVIAGVFSFFICFFLTRIYLSSNGRDDKIVLSFYEKREYKTKQDGIVALIFFLSSVFCFALVAILHQKYKWQI